MTRIRFAGVLGLCILLAVALLGADMNKPPAKEADPLAVALTVEASAKADVALDLQLTNKSKTPLTLYKSSLPWSGQYGMTLIVLETNRAEGRQLKRGPVPIDDPTPEKVTIAPGESVSGRISLSKRYPGLVDSLKKSDVEVFWSYKMRTTDDNTEVRRVGGWTLIEKSGEQERKR